MKKLTVLLSFVLVATFVFAQTPTPPPAPEAPDAGPVTEISFEEPTYKFGKIKQGEKVEHVFTFTNTGVEPLVISNAKGSCGCTVPEWPREVIAPGETGDIKVIFNSARKKGHRNQRVTITANTEPAQTVISLQGEVLVDEKVDDHSGHDHSKHDHSGHDHSKHGHNHKH